MLDCPHIVIEGRAGYVRRLVAGYLKPGGPALSTVSEAHAEKLVCGAERVADALVAAGHLLDPRLLPAPPLEAGDVRPLDVLEGERAALQEAQAEAFKWRHVASTAEAVRELVREAHEVLDAAPDVDVVTAAQLRMEQIAVSHKEAARLEAELCWIRDMFWTSGCRARLRVAILQERARLAVRDACVRPETIKDACRCRACLVRRGEPEAWGRYGTPPTDTERISALEHDLERVRARHRVLVATNAKAAEAGGIGPEAHRQAREGHAPDLVDAMAVEIARAQTNEERLQGEVTRWLHLASNLDCERIALLEAIEEHRAQAHFHGGKEDPEYEPSDTVLYAAARTVREAAITDPAETPKHTKEDDVKSQTPPTERRKSAKELEEEARAALEEGAAEGSKAAPVPPATEDATLDQVEEEAQRALRDAENAAAAATPPAEEEPPAEEDPDAPDDSLACVHCGGLAGEHTPSCVTLLPPLGGNPDTPPAEEDPPAEDPAQAEMEEQSGALEDHDGADIEPAEEAVDDTAPDALGVVTPEEEAEHEDQVAAEIAAEERRGQEDQAGA